VRESERGGMAHACELETSVYLHLDAGRVRQEHIRRDMNMPASEFIWQDLIDGCGVLFMDEWTRFSKSGVCGDPTRANAEKGQVIFEAVVEAFLRLVREFKNRPRGERTDWHKETWRG
jgi:creatinine amidohydrolase